VTYFSWAALGYSFKFLWAPLVDRLPLPWLTVRLGRRRAWLLFAQFIVIMALVWMGSIDPSLGEGSLTLMAFATVMLGFSAATQDAVIDAYRIEVAEIDMQSLLASTYTAGYRSGMIISGAGALVLAHHFGSSIEHYDYSAWQWTYYSMALVMLIGVSTTLLILEPTAARSVFKGFTGRQYLRLLVLFAIGISTFVLCFNLLSAPVVEYKLELSNILKNQILANTLLELTRLLVCLAGAATSLLAISKTPVYERELVNISFVQPITDFFKRYGLKSSMTILIFVGFYRISDIVLGVIANVFYQDMGFNSLEIAGASKTFGLVMTILGGFLGGVFSARYGVMRVLVVGAILVMLTNLLFVLLANVGYNVSLLYAVISADNLAGGIATTAFIAYLAALVNVSFTASQYAIFSSLMTLIPKTIGGYSGAIVDTIGYQNFFFFASALGIPVLFILYFVAKIDTTHLSTTQKT
jgi:MFS transporter, PAT family, beta-lactamase induction signal transducer AmpG